MKGQTSPSDFQNSSKKSFRVRIPYQLFFCISTRKYFTILFKILDFLRILDRFKLHIRVIISEFFRLGEKISLKYLLIGGVGGDVCPPCQTLSTTCLFFNLIWKHLGVTKNVHSLFSGPKNKTYVLQYFDDEHNFHLKNYLN